MSYAKRVEAQLELAILRRYIDHHKAVELTDPPPAKGPNKGGQPPAEDLEGRACTEENAVGRATDRTTNRVQGAGRRAERRLL